MRVERAHVDDAFGREPKDAPARYEQREPGRGRENRCQLARGLDDVFEVVEHDEKLPSGQLRADRILPARGFALTKAERPRKRRNDLVGARKRGKVDEQRPVRELVPEGAGDLDREPGLADPARPDKRDEPCGGTEQKLAQSLEFAVTADRPRRRRRYAPGGDPSGPRRTEARVMTEDPALELSELHPRCEPELGVEVGAPQAIAGERVRLSTRSVQRGHQLGP